MAGTGNTRERNVQTPGWMRRPTASPSARAAVVTAADAAAQDGHGQGGDGQDGDGQDGGTAAADPGAGNTAAPGSRRTRILLLATGGVGVLVVAGVTIGIVGASSSAGHATTVSGRQSHGAQAAAAPPLRVLAPR